MTQRRSVIGALNQEVKRDGKARASLQQSDGHTAIAAAAVALHLRQQAGVTNTAPPKDSSTPSVNAEACVTLPTSLQVHHVPAHPLHGRVKDLGVGAHVVGASKLLGIMHVENTAANGEGKVVPKEAKVSAALQSAIGQTVSIGGEFSGLQNPLAAFREKKSREGGKLDDSVRDLLDALSSVERFTDKNAAKTGLGMALSGRAVKISSATSSVTTANTSANATSLTPPTPEEEAQAEAVANFVPNRLKVMSGLYLAELAPQLRFLPPEDRERLLSLCDNGELKERDRSRRSSILASPRGSRATLTLATPQVRKSVRHSEVRDGVGATVPMVSELLDEHEEEEQLLRALQLPPLLLEHNDVCMDGMQGADIVSYLVEWTCSGMKTEDLEK